MQNCVCRATQYSTSRNRNFISFSKHNDPLLRHLIESPAFALSRVDVKFAPSLLLYDFQRFEKRIHRGNTHSYVV